MSPATPSEQPTPSPAGFPTTRLRRLRHNPLVRRLVQETRLHPSDFILPYFICDGTNVRKPIGAMPGVFQLSLDQFENDVRSVADLGLGGILLFGVPDAKDTSGRAGCSDDGLVPRAVKLAKQAAPNLLVVTDVCLCEYMEHGHCGVVVKTGGRADVDNDATLELLARQAVSHAQAGADMVAPSAMMDGMVHAIRSGLDTAGFGHLPLMSYAAKYASAFYGPFREAAQSAPQFGDRRSYQMDYAGRPGEALREIELDIAEGADIIMVKPALAYLDVIKEASTRWPGLPLAAYNVSGEYSMVKAAAAQGWIDERAVVLESLTAIRRAGANIIISYWAQDVARWLASPAT
ncbi:MAG: porphobilinogen synthase [Planctomycetes bacterium]|nr:porphobilinogen synthase [Planctomycetota bacterium]